MKSKVLDSWVGRRIVVQKPGDVVGYPHELDGELLEYGSCWLALRLTETGEEQVVRLGGHDRVRLARPTDLTYPEWQEQAKLRGREFREAIGRCR